LVGTVSWKQEDGGKVLSSRTRKSNSRVSNALRLAAQTLHRSHSYLGAYYRRMRARLGAPQAITAAAHKPARIVYHLISTRTAYDESVFAQEEQKQTIRNQHRLRKQALALGFQLVPITLPRLFIRRGCDFFDFAQTGCCRWRWRVVDVSTALSLGNGPLLSATLSFLSSRAKPRDLRFYGFFLETFCRPHSSIRNCLNKKALTPLEAEIYELSAQLTSP
jgi:hypothetical protein